jgi:ribosomal protein S18 acetylase RimI-like enzyme
MISIRPFHDTDLAAVIELWRACGLTQPWNPPQRDIEFCRGSGHGELFVAEADQRIVGSVMAGHDGHRGWIYYVAVDPAGRLGGLGRKLVEHAEAWLVSKGVPKAMLLIRETNTAVAAFYERLGYAVEPRILMTKWLRDETNDGSNG